MTSAPPPAPGPPAPLSARLRTAVVDMRSELDISRHVFRDGVSYVIRDPISFRSHRLSASDFAILTSLSQDRTLGDVFTSLVERNELTRDDEESFYSFIVDLHRQGLLTLPINDSESLYQRCERRRALARRSALLSILSFKCPLWNPDRFLTATAPLFAWMFTRAAIVLWAFLMIAAGAVVALRWNDLSTPLLSSLSGDNLVFLWFTLIGLKIVHEFGHAYACKVLGGGGGGGRGGGGAGGSGGHVPEMGAMFVLLTPCAYVDATDSWSFDDRARRIGVALAGMYFESIVGAAALFLWAATDVGTVNTVAYQALLLSTVVTVGFNLNPLMKFDGYFVLSDLVGIPNLRTRAQEQLTMLLRRVAAGRHAVVDSVRPALLAFGAGVLVYRLILVLSICTLIATQLHFIGLAAAAAFLIVTFFGAGAKMFRYLLVAEEARAARVRSIAAALIALVLLPAAAALLPVPLPIHAWGVVEQQDRTVYRTPESAHLVRLQVKPGQHVERDDLLASFVSPELDAQLAEAAAELAAANVVANREQTEAPAPSGPAQADVALWTARLHDITRRREHLNVRAAAAGHIVSMPALSEGMFIPAGEELATSAAGPWRVAVLLDESDFVAAQIRLGRRLPCRVASDAAQVQWGTVEQIEEVGARAIPDPALTSLAGGPISLQPSTPEPHADRPYFRILLKLDAPSPTLVRGSTARVSIQGETLTLAHHARRTFERFLMKLRAAQS